MWRGSAGRRRLRSSVYLFVDFGDQPPRWREVHRIAVVPRKASRGPHVIIRPVLHLIDELTVLRVLRLLVAFPVVSVSHETPSLGALCLPRLTSRKRAQEGPITFDDLLAFDDCGEGFRRERYRLAANSADRIDRHGSRVITPDEQQRQHDDRETFSNLLLSSVHHGMGKTVACTVFGQTWRSGQEKSGTLASAVQNRQR